jgi:hypothetical protein
MSSAPDATAFSTTYWMIGQSTIGSISFGWLFVAGRIRVPSPAAGMTTFIGPPENPSVKALRAMPPRPALRPSVRLAPPRAG